MRLAVIIGSTRRGRFGPTVAHWLAQQAAKEFDIDLIDLAAASLPGTLPDTDDQTPQEVAALSSRLPMADAFAVVTPEINCSFPASLKTTLDWYYEEWHAKPVAIVSYGREHGGCHVTAQLRQVFTELQAVTIRNAVALPCCWGQFTADGGWPKPSAGYEAAAKLMLDQLVWWAEPVQDARNKRPYQPREERPMRKLIELSAERTRQAIVEHTRRLAESAATAGPDAAVPTAPEWTVTNLVEHVGQTQHWVADIIERRITDPTQLPTELAVLPADPSEWQAWLSESAQRVADACSDDALDAPVFNAAGDERSGTQFWMSSMLNESVVHGFDAANAASTANMAGRPAGTDVDADIAAALISNHLAMLTSPTWEMQRPESAHAIRGTGQTLQWLATDTAGDAGSWFVERRPDGATWQPGTHQADVTMTGPAGSLLLTMTRRVPLTDREATGITIDGDTDLAQHWLDNTAHVTD